MNAEDLTRDAYPFVDWMARWYNGLARISIDQFAQWPERVAVLSVDVVQGFCHEGPLASERVATIVEPIIRLFKVANAKGLQHLILIQDHHPPEAIEFGSYPPHCVVGTVEAETMPQIQALPFFDQFLLMTKNSISSFMATELESWLEAHPEVDTFLVVGDCTDLCTYQLAMGLRLRANALQQEGVRIILPADCVQTYHLPVSVAQEMGAVPHHGDLLHLTFLYSMMLNGVEVAAGIDAAAIAE